MGYNFLSNTCICILLLRSASLYNSHVQYSTKAVIDADPSGNAIML